MIDMFTNYQNLSDYYIPNNISEQKNIGKSYTKLDPINGSKPYELYSAKNELEGYYWYYGDALNLEFNIDGEITVESNSIIFRSPDQQPTLTTEGRIEQRAYNIIDLRSWTCVSFENGLYIWEEDEEFVYPLNGDKQIYVSAKDYLSDKTINIELYNFRLERIAAKSYNGSNSVIFEIDKDLSSKLVKGIYYCSLTVDGADIHQTLFAPQDCKLLVK